jgi:hypothetical protein
MARRRREGKTDREARRALKRFRCRPVLRAWDACPPLTLDDLAPYVLPPDDTG